MTRLALAEFTVGNTEEFKKNLGSALEQDSRYTPALKARADFNLSISSHKKAATDYVDIIKIEPENVEALLALAVCFYETGDKDATTMTYERVLTIDPDNTLAKDNLATEKQHVVARVAFCFFEGNLTNNPRPSAPHNFLHFRHRGHGGISGGCHSQRSVGSTIINRFSGITSC